MSQAYVFRFRVHTRSTAGGRCRSCSTGAITPTDDGEQAAAVAKGHIQTPAIAVAGACGRARGNPCKDQVEAHTILSAMGKNKDKSFEVACPDCGAMLKIDGATGLVVSHTSAPRKRMF